MFCYRVNDSLFYVGFGTIWLSHLVRPFSNHSYGYAFSNDHTTCLALSPQIPTSR